MKKIIAFILFAFFMIHGSSIFAQGSTNSYTFKYILKPRYKTKTQLKFKPNPAELKELKNKEKQVDKRSQDYRDVNNKIGSIQNQIKYFELESKKKHLKQSEYSNDTIRIRVILDSLNHIVENDNTIFTINQKKNKELYVQISNKKLDTAKSSAIKKRIRSNNNVLTTVINEIGQDENATDSIKYFIKKRYIDSLSEISNSLNLINSAIDSNLLQRDLLNKIADSIKITHLSDSLYIESLKKDIEITKRNLFLDNKNAPFHYLKNFFDVLFLGTGYNRNFNMSDVIFDDTIHTSSNPAYKASAYLRLEGPDQNFKRFSIDTLIPPPDTVWHNNDFLDGPLGQSDQQPKQPPILHQQQSLPMFKFNPQTQTLDELDAEKAKQSSESGNGAGEFSMPLIEQGQEQFYPSNNLFFPTWKRKWNHGKKDTGDYKKYLKFKYGVDVLYTKTSVQSQPGVDTEKTTTTTIVTYTLDPAKSKIPVNLKVMPASVITTTFSVTAKTKIQDTGNSLGFAATTATGIAKSKMPEPVKPLLVSVNTTTVTTTVQGNKAGTLTTAKPITIITTGKAKIDTNITKDDTSSVTTMTINPTPAVISKNVYTSYSIVSDGNTSLSHPALKCYILSKPNSDTMMMMPWYRKHVAQHNADRDLKLIKNIPGHDYNDSIVFRDDVIALAHGRHEPNPYMDTFYFVIPNNFNTADNKNSNYNKFNLYFNTKYLIPISIPFQDIGFSFRKPIVLQSNFLSAGMAYGWARGKTTFFKNDQVTTKNFYMGAGFVAALAQASDTTKNQTNSGKSYPALCVGVHIGLAISALQVIIAGGYGAAVEDAHTPWGPNGAPWVGFGIGLSLFNVTIPSINGGAGGGGTAGGK